MAREKQWRLILIVLHFYKMHVEMASNNPSASNTRQPDPDNASEINKKIHDEIYVELASENQSASNMRQPDLHSATEINKKAIDEIYVDLASENRSASNMRRPELDNATEINKKTIDEINVETASENRSASNTRRPELDNATEINKKIHVTEIKDSTINVTVKTIDTGGTNADRVANNPSTETEEPIFRLWRGDDVSTTSRSLQDDIIPEDITKGPSPTSSVATGRIQKMTVQRRRIEYWRYSFRQEIPTYVPTLGPLHPVLSTKVNTKRVFTHGSYPYVFNQVTEDYWMPYMGASNGSSKGNWVFSRSPLIPLPTDVVTYWETGSHINSALYPHSVGSLFSFNPSAVANFIGAIVSGNIIQNSYMNYVGSTQVPEADLSYCNQYYNRMGPICGYYLSQKDLKYHYKNFNNYCHMQKDNFGWRDKRDGVSYTIHNRGTCTSNINDLLPKTWSSQDGIWKRRSIREILQRASRYDAHVLEMNQKPFIEYDYKCKTYFQGYDSTYVNDTGACYFFAEDAVYSFDQVSQKCHEKEGVAITIESIVEKDAVARLIKKNLGWSGRTKLYWSDWVQRGGHTWVRNEDETETDDLMNRGFNPWSDNTLDPSEHSPGWCGVLDGWELRLYRRGVNCERSNMMLCKRVVPLD